MATNGILRFAETDTGTNLLTQAEYSADSQRPIGNQPGVARSKLVNKALRQSSLIAAAVAQFIADNQANNVVDTATPADIADWIEAAVRSIGIPTAVAGGTANAITADFTPNVALTNGTTVIVRAGVANTTTTPTFSPDGLTAKTIVKGNNLALTAGDIAGAGHWIELQYDAALDKWVLANPATGISVTTVPDASTAVKGKVQLATAAEAQAGTDALKVLTPATLAATLSAKTSTFYTASCAVGTVFAITHGMGAVAAMRSITYGIECVTAELGYSAGDRVFTQSNDGARSFGFNIDGTTARFLTNGSSVGIYNKATASSVNNAITPANWRFFLIISV